MQCSKCKFQNPEEMQFCGKCGSKLTNPCSKCGFENPEAFEFCGKCGKALQQSLDNSEVDYKKSQSYTSKHLTDKILTTKSSIEGERKVLTVLFTDATNYTSISEKLDPEEVHQIMDACFKILKESISKYEGTVDKFTGDGVMALFGAPVAHENHAHLACYAALAIQEALISFSARVKQDYGINFKMRIGLNSGAVVVGGIGDDLHMDYTALGDTVNLASRMESNAEPGSILVSESTYRLVKDDFETEPIGEIQVKGKEKLQKAFRLIKSSDTGTRIGASVARGLTRFVGRENSLAILIEAFARAKSGSGQLIGIVGEPGVGKSRLIYEMRQRIPENEFKYFEGRCLQYGSSILYLPVLDILRSIFNIKDEDSELIIKRKIYDSISALDDQFKTLIPPIQSILSLTVDDREFVGLEAKQKREKIFEALRYLLIRISKDQPIIIAFEDLHWIDKTSEAFLQYLIDWLANEKVLIILLYRPEYIYSWGNKSFYTKININQLDKESSKNLVKAILKEINMAPEVSQLILDRSAGNPLFMEEFTHALIERGFIEIQDHQYTLKKKIEEISIPHTIQGIIASRIDRLEDNLKSTLQVASVIGRDFAHKILETITGIKNELRYHLLNLQGLELIYEKNLFPELEYFFKHALTQEVVYNSLLQKRKKVLHEKIGIAIENLYAEKMEEYYEVLTYHFCKSDNLKKAVKYSKLASKKAEKNASLDSASYFIQKMIETLEKMPISDEVTKQLINARVTKGLFMYQLFNFVDAQKAIDPILDNNRTMNDKKRAAHVHTISGSYDFWVKEEPALAFNHLKTALILSKEENNISAQFFANMSLGQAASFAGEFDTAGNCFDNALKINTALNNLWGISTVKSAISFYSYIFKGDVNSGIKTSEEALAFAEKSGDSYSLSGAYLSHGISNYYMGFFKKSISLLSEAIEHCKRMALNIWNSYAHYFTAMNDFQLGNFQNALSQFKTALEFLKEAQSLPSFQDLIKIKIILTEIILNEKEKSLENIPSIIQSNKLAIYNTSFYRNYSRILLSRNKENIPMSEIWIKKAIESDKRNNNLWNLGMDYLILTELTQEKNYQQEALKTSKSFFKKSGSTGWCDYIELKTATLK